MSTFTKSAIAFGVVAGVFGLAAFLGYSPFLKVVQQAIGGSSSGSTFTTAKTAYVAINLASAGANGTSTSILNGDSQDRVVKGVDVACGGVGTSKTAYAGAGLANLFFTLGTTSTSAPAAYPAGFNKIGGVDYNLSTSTPNTLIASSTAGVSTTSIVWATGSYLTIFSNATNTATCTAGVTYIPR